MEEPYSNGPFPIQERFPIGIPLIAPIWFDLSEYFPSRLWYRVTTNNDTIQRVREEVARAFPELTTFSATQVLIATWIHDDQTVNYHNNTINMISLLCFSFISIHTQTPVQLRYQCILATDGFYSFVFFLYGDLHVDASYLFFLPEVVEVGLNAGNGVDFISLTQSLNSSILDIVTQSNVGCPGVFVFQTNGVAQQPQSQMQCEQICINTNGSIICECNPGYQLNEDLLTCSGMYNT